MGKKSRVRTERRLEKEKLNAKLAEQKKEKQKTARTIITSVCAFVLVLALIFGVSAAVTGSGVLLRGAVSLSTEHIEIDNAMLSYFFYNNFYNYLANNSLAAQQSGLNTTISLKSQNYSSSLTWFDYIMGRTVNELSSYLVLAEAAKAEGLELNDEDLEKINTTLASIETNAKKEGVSKQKYIAASYGRGVKEDDIRRALEVVFLADKKNSEIADSIEFTSDERAKYFGEHKEDFTYVSYKYFKLSADDYFGKDNMPDDAEDRISVIAATFGSAKTEKDFDAKVKEYLTASYKNKGEELKDDELETLIKDTVMIDSTNYSDNFSKWAFDEARVAGDTIVLSEDGVHTAYLLTDPAHSPDYTTKNIRQILITVSKHENDAGAKAEAERILAEWKSGEATDASFETLAEKYSEGLNPYYENLGKNTGLAEFDEWVYDESRKTGDAEIVKTYYGYHILYFVGDGMVAWEANVEDKMKNEKYEEITKELGEAHPIKYNTKKYNGVSGKVPSL